MSKPYYEQDGVTIYHGDCREILPTLQPCDLLLTDPPYGINYHARSLGANETRASRTHYEGEGVVGDDVVFDPSAFLTLAPVAILWGANHYAAHLPISAGWLVCDKKTQPQFYGSTTFSDCELAWTNAINRALIFPHLWNGIVREGQEAARKGYGRVHPTQKPVALMRWCVGVAGAAKTVLDPFAGSGTTLVAAKAEGRRAIGIELEEKYCEIAAKRLQQGALPLEMGA